MKKKIFLKIKTFKKPSIALSMHFLKTKILYRTYLHKIQFFFYFLF